MEKQNSIVLSSQKRENKTVSRWRYQHVFEDFSLYLSLSSHLHVHGVCVYVCVCEPIFVLEETITQIFWVPVQENAEQRAESLRRVQQIRQSDSRKHL